MIPPTTFRVLIGLSVALAVMLFALQRGQPGGELNERRLLPGIAAARLVRIELWRGEKRQLELRRKEASWQLVFPRSLPASGATVDRLLTQLEQAEWLRKTPQLNQASLGLAPARVRLRLANTQGLIAELRLGKADASGEGLYARLGDTSLLLDKGLAWLADATAASFVSRSLVTTDTSGIRWIEWVNRGQRQRLERGKGGFFWRHGGQLYLAPQGAAAKVFAALSGLQATHLRLREKEPATNKAVSTLRYGETKGPGGVLHLGGACVGYPTERALRIERGETRLSACISGEVSWETLVVAAARPELRLVPLDRAQLEALDLSCDGKAAVRLFRAGSAWVVAAGKGRRFSAQEAPLDALLRQLLGWRATGAGVASPTHQGSGPRCTIIARGVGGLAYELRLWNDGEGRGVAQRAHAQGRLALAEPSPLPALMRQALALGAAVR